MYKIFRFLIAALIITAMLMGCSSAPLSETDDTIQTSMSENSTLDSTDNSEVADGSEIANTGSDNPQKSSVESSDIVKKNPQPPKSDHDNGGKTENTALDINRYREDYNIGTCRSLSGKVAAVMFYIDDFESSWTDSEMQVFTENEIKPAFKFLENSAKGYGVDLKINITDTFHTEYKDKVITSVKRTGYCTVDVAWCSAENVGYASDNDLVRKLRARDGVETVIIYTVFNKNGTAYALNPKKDSDLNIAEHCIIFSHDYNDDGNYKITGSQSSVIAHETLHLFGAEDMYATAERKAVATKEYPRDIMLSTSYYINTNNIGVATAFYIGWTNTLPEPIKHESWGK